MYVAPSYLAWAIEHHGRAKYDLATSGTPPVPLADLGSPDLDDPRAWRTLRSAIAAHLAVDDGDVIATLGTAHAMWLGYASLTSPGDEILVEAPAYEPLLTAAGGCGVVVKRFLRRRENGYAIEPHAVEAALGPKTRVVVLSNLHNPTGARASDDDLRDLASRFSARGVWLFVDEVYAPFDALVGEDGVWRGSARHLGKNVVCASSLTKCYGLGQHRFGWLSGPRDVIARAEAAILSTCGMLPLSHAAWGTLAFAALPRLAERARRLLGDKRAVVERWIASRPDLAWSAPREGLFGFVHARDGRSLDARLARALDAREVIVAPGRFFEGPDGFRLAWSTDEASLKSGLLRLAAFLDESPR